MIYAEARRLAEEALGLPEVVLARSRSRLDALVEALLEHGTMSAAEIEALVATRSGRRRRADTEPRPAPDTQPQRSG